MSRTLPDELYRAGDVRELDRLAIEEFGIPGYTLMCRAGAAAFQALSERWPEARRVIVFCGGGNNGGDGYVIARLALEAGFEVRVFHLAEPVKLKGSARRAYEAAAQAGVPMEDFEPERAARAMDPEQACVVVDAMLGTGISGEVRGAIRQAITLLNRCGSPVLAVDIASGLDSDSGQEPGEAVRADLTVTFIGLKLGQFLGQGPACTGELHYDSLGVPPAVFSRVPPAARRPTPAGDAPA